MKVKYLIILMMTVAGTMFSSCDRDELFEREQYKKVIALLSEKDDIDFNVFVEEHHLKNTVSQGYISAVCGGALPAEEDINISIIEDDELLLEYNVRKFDTIGESSYARRLPYANYAIAGYNIRIPAGERKGLLDIKVYPNGLSPDSVYFLPLRIEKFSNYELNEDKAALLYRVYMKNFYSTTKSEVRYTMRSILDGLRLVSDKRVYPVSANSVRILAGDVTLGEDNALPVIEAGSLLLTVADDGKVTITSWRGLKVTQLDDDPDYPNTFQIFDDGFSKYKMFLLNYEYEYLGTTHTMKEELRLEYDEKKEKDE
jgi:hypothetical protein